jgi:hypothetical protein
MIFKLAEAAEKSWRRLDGYNQLPKVILGVKFTDGIEVIRSQAAPRKRRLDSRARTKARRARGTSNRLLSVRTVRTVACSSDMVLSPM